jgi:hypothetical protein
MTEGAKPIPREPTDAMIAAAWADDCGDAWISESDLRRYWRAMWDAAPSPEGVGLTRELVEALVAGCIYPDSFGVHGSDFFACRICQHESGAGIYARENWHAPDCPAAAVEKALAAVGQEGPSEPEGGG